MLEELNVSCPYCGESFQTLVDLSAGEQEYYEDCQVCCRPIEFCIRLDEQLNLSVQTLRDDD